MAKLTKTQDTANWRKAKDLQVGDVVLMAKLNAEGRIDYAAGRDYVAVASISMEARQYRLFDATGTYTRRLTGNEFAEGRYEV